MNASAIGKRIKQARLAQNMTQEALAKALGCTSRHVSAMERGVKMPGVDTLVKIANTLEVSTDYLLQDALRMDGQALVQIVDSLPPDRKLCWLRAIDAFEAGDKR